MSKSKNISTICAVVAGIAAVGIILFINPINKGTGMNMSNTNNISKDAIINSSLPIPALLEDKNPDPKVDDFTLEPQQGEVSFIKGTETKTTGYNGNFLGPVIRVNKGDEVNIHVNNKLSEPTTVHWHGLELNGENDGGPDQAIQAGATWNPSFVINQQAATLWYHPHFSGTTATQVYSGLAGLFYVDDEISKNLNIPKEYGVNDIPLVIQDRSFNKDGSFKYDTNMMDGATGDTILVNGAIKPYLDVKRVKMRFRIVNGANASNFNLKLDNGSAFYQIASDGGFLESPISQKSILLAPGERAEIIIDFSKYDKGTKVSLMSDKTEILNFNVKEDGNDTTEIPGVLTKINKIEKSQATKVRNFDLQGMGNMVSINGQKFDMNRIDETVKQGDIEIWNITSENSMMHNMGHPFHIHGVQFQILSRDGKEPATEEKGWKDTVYIEPNEKVSIIVRFNNKGTFMYHCHILEHEEAGMMGQIKVE
ncbi:multicopper oxidase mco [Clostridium folliculivorans]|uniref:Multicopper oxidase mco n=1 Tax=Clostridium folliculivorans TaxID=2886038 RepID=A0A9W6DD48_9CLOT|nr:multicopper oxidase domain-containing protein [Clostridium folliculivorans]GKU27587.1 multicopper oxidase mco [Clostridium folliculivorans]